MSDTAGAVLMILGVLLGVAVLFLLCLAVLSYVAAHASEAYDKRQKKQARRATIRAVTACEHHGCPPGTGEHLCRHDPIDEVALHHIETLAYTTDPKWYARMAGKKGTP